MNTARRFVAATAATVLLALGSIALAAPAQAADDDSRAPAVDLGALLGGRSHKGLLGLGFLGNRL